MLTEFEQHHRVWNGVYGRDSRTHGKINWTGLIYAAGGMDRVQQRAFDAGGDERCPVVSIPRSFGTERDEFRQGFSSFCGSAAVKGGG